MMRDIRQEVDRTLLLLRNTIRRRGWTQLEVQEVLGWGRSYISQLFTRQKALRLEQLLSILAVVGTRPEELFGELYRWPDSGAAPPRRTAPPTPAEAGELRREVSGDVDRALDLLRDTILTRGSTQLEVQEKLGWGRSYISQLLSGQKNLRLEQVLGILSALEIPPGEFFFALYRPGEELPAAAPARRPGKGEEGRRLDEVRAVVRRLAWVLVEKGVLTRAEIPLLLEELLTDEPGFAAGGEGRRDRRAEERRGR